MIRYLKYTEIDKARWDECISHACNGVIYAFSWYLDIVCPQRWDALVKDDYAAVFPIPQRKKAGIRYVFTPFFVQQLGAFGPGHAHINADEFLDAIPEEFRLVELALNSGNTADSPHFHFRTNLNHELNLGKSYNELRKQYSENLLRNIRRGEKNAVKLVRAEDPGKIISLFRAGKGREIRHWRDKEYSILMKLAEACRKRDLLDIREAYSGTGEFLAGMMLLHAAERAIFIFSATGPAAKETGAMPLMIDRFVQENAGSKKVLDFEGSNDANLARFYKSFGAKEITYSLALKNQLPRLINFIKRRFR